MTPPLISNPLTATASAEMHQAIVAWLLRRATYADQPEGVEHIETHLSDVFLTDRFVYKLKKPVKFEFVDFSARQARRQACQAELTLNRRLAPDIYLGVLPIGIASDGRPQWLDTAAESRAVDWVVKMRRLPLELSLDRLIQQQCLTDGQVKQLAERLARFYATTAPMLVQPDRYLAEIERHVQANRAELTSVDDPTLAQKARQVHAAQLQYLRLQSSLFAERAADGRIVDGHGDLRPEHIVLTAPPVVFDCVEFNDEFRHLDVLDELCFLAMECEALSAEQVGQAVLAAYQRESGDIFPPSLVAFYKSYRACVRAKVALLRSRQHEDGATDQAAVARYLELAHRYRDVFHQPVLIVTSGLSGTGKSTLAAELEQHMGLVWLRTDAIRREMFGASVQSQAFGAGNYTPALRQQVYEEMFRRADRILERGESVVLDGAFLSTLSQHGALDLARQRKAPVLLARCECPDKEARERIAHRLASGGDPSEATPELVAQQRLQAEPPPAGLPVCRIDTSDALAAQVRTLVRTMRQQQLGR